MTSTTILAAAEALAAAGISVVPVRADGTKRPAGEWAQWQQDRATVDTIRQWFGVGLRRNEPRHTALGIITGAISGNLEMAEIEGRAAHQIPEIQALAYDSGFGPLWEKLCSGWLERSPSGGMHWFYRLAGTPAGNTKLARRPATLEELAENPKEKWKVLTETRGEGGFVVVAPSGGHTHNSGRPWEVVAGGPETVPTITAEEHEQFQALLASINEEPAAPEPVRHLASVPAGGLFGAVSPGDDFEARTDWADILVPAGWRFAFEAGGVRYWTRPGKSFGISATTGKDPARDRLFVFTSASDFEAETPYTKFGAYALLHYDGDHSRAASALRKTGFGKDPEISTGGTTWDPNSQASPFAANVSAPASPAATATVSVDGWTTTGAPAATAQAGSPSPSTGSQASGTSPAVGATGQDEGHGVEGNLATVTEIRPVRRPTMAYTDDGNAALLIHTHGEVLRYNADRGRWLHWSGHLWEWQPGSGGMARELAKDVIRSMDVEGNDAARQWKKKSLSASAITNMLVQAQTDPAITVETDKLDANPWELNTPGGIIDLRTATLIPPNPASMHTKSTKVTPDFDKVSEQFNTFLNDTFQQDHALREYVQRLLGYSAVGIVREHILPLATGKGGNGKGVLFETVKAVLGDYATSAPEGFLMKTQFQAHTTDLASLQGARFVIQSEVNKDDKFDEGKIKRLAGGDSITARFMRKDNFTFTPTHQLWLMMNHRPGVEAGGDSFWRRVRIIPFTYKVPDDKKIVDLQTILADEEHGPVVLAWIARGAAEYYRHGLQEPASVLAATEDYKQEVDTVARFLEDECTVDPNPTLMSAATPCNTVINAYERWCRHDGSDPLKGKEFTNALADHGIRAGREVPKTANGQRQYLGVTLNSSPMYNPAIDDAPAEGTPFAQGKVW